jgi:ketosteroid isomerase-like protein
VSGAEALAVVERFNMAFNAHDVDAVMAEMSQDCVFEGTAPPDGDRHVGADAVRAAWVALFGGSPRATFSTEETICAGDRVIVRWLYRWDEPDDSGSGHGSGSGSGHVCGVDVFRVEAGLITEKLAYVKG